VNKDSARLSRRAIERMIMKSPPWIILVTIIIGVMLIAWNPLGFGITLLGIPLNPWMVISLIIIIYVGRNCILIIPSKPPYVGLVTIWGRRTTLIKEEGWRLFAPWFPFLFDAIPINVGKKNKDFIFPELRMLSEKVDKKKREEILKTGEKNNHLLQAGGKLTQHISITFHPDYKNKNAGERLISYINSGGAEGVIGIIRDLIEESLRELTYLYTWEEWSFNVKEIRAKLLYDLTGQNVNGKEGDKIEIKLRAAGLPDSADLGIIIDQFNVGKTKESGDIEKAADNRAREEQAIRGHKLVMDFINEQVERLQMERGLSPGEALDAVQSAMGQAQKKVQTLRGIDDVANSVCQTVREILK
jgi:hypothetical protein